MKRTLEAILPRLAFLNDLLLVLLVTTVLVELVGRTDQHVMTQAAASALFGTFFLAEWLIGLWVSADRRAWLRDPFRIAELVSALPFGLAFQGARLLRLTRLVRLARLWVRARDFNAELSSLGRTLALAAMVTLCGAVGLRAVEPETVPTLSDALWWSLVTVSTVGYGDLSPATEAGRIIGSVLIFCGVGSFGYVAGFMSNLIDANRSANESDELSAAPEPDPVVIELTAIRSELERLREALSLRAEAGPAKTGAGGLDG